MRVPHVHYCWCLFVSFPVRLTELCVGDRKALQEPFVWITSRMVSCAGEDTIFFLFEETNETTAATEAKNVTIW